DAFNFSRPIASIAEFPHVTLGQHPISQANSSKKNFLPGFVHDVLSLGVKISQRSVCRRARNRKTNCEGTYICSQSSHLTIQLANMMKGSAAGEKLILHYLRIRLGASWPHASYEKYGN